MGADVVAIVLAAGGGSRFGGPKQVASVGGLALVRHAVRAARGAGVSRVAVVVGGHAAAVGSAVAPDEVEVVHASDWDTGQAASLRAGLAAVRDARWLLVLLADQPGVGAAAVERLLARREAGLRAVRASYRGRPGHPVLLSAELVPELRALTGDQGARSLLEEGVRLVACDDVADGDDVDTQHDLERARSRHR